MSETAGRGKGAAVTRSVSALVAAAALLLLAWRPGLLTEGGPLLDRAALAVMLAGIAGSIGNACGLMPSRRPLQFACRPAVAWPAVAIGAFWLLLRRG